MGAGGGAQHAYPPALLSHRRPGRVDRGHVRSRGGGVQPRGHPPTCQRTHALPATRAACGPRLRQRVWLLAAGPARGDARGGDDAALAGPAHRGSACDVRRGSQWEPRMEESPADTEGLQREQSQGGHARPLTVEQQIDRPCPGGAARPTAEAVPNAPAAPRGQRRRSPCCQDPGVGPARPARGRVADGLRVLRGAASTPRPAPQLRFAANGAVRQGGASPEVALQTAHACGGARDETWVL